jgi:TetR/AcrR family transcriptional regulator
MPVTGNAAQRRKPGPRSSNTTTHPAFDRNDQFEKRRLAMLQIAIGAFNRTGFHATSMEVIAAELGLTKGTLYHYYESKTALLYECVLHSVEDGRVLAVNADAAGGSGLEKLEHYLRAQFQTLAGERGSSWLMADISALPAAQQTEVRRASRVVDALVQKFIAEGVADGSVQSTHPKIAEFFLMGALNWLPRWYSPQGSMGSAELTEIFIRMVFDGIRARGGVKGKSA